MAAAKNVNPPNEIVYRAGTPYLDKRAIGTGDSILMQCADGSWQEVTAHPRTFPVMFCVTIQKWDEIWWSEPALRFTKFAWPSE